ncbi:MAG: bifunctional diaminohydroxyphosphoribosylaminopyrimidine deaminase/5-amino-6-(5-phosphoribosylamino)uracil reductase RibD [Thermodesulfovibrionia bacterium]|nr:bifunctional diaminohydroxyphosphoribosylaminopyrimidine deaminase/5-amino-6-(5-phosphoribosylamino)uracil reductase RibD [Thermodesulfovibrionia bacterium]
MTKNEMYIKKALALAAKGIGRTSPNPAVGAVIVKNNRVIAADYHKKAGEPHAEALALAKAGSDAKGATLYINLEPCCHTDKKTPPCTSAIIRSGINKVVVSMLDPNPKVSGKGIEALCNAGIETEVGIMEREASKLNEAFVKFITTKKPFVILKIAQSIDGKIADAKGESKWITGEKARKHVHKLRNELDAVMVGIGTVIKDDPSLDCRMIRGRNPYRIIIDSALRISLNSKVLGYKDGKTIIATTDKAAARKIDAVRKTGHQVMIVKSRDKHVDLQDLVSKLGKMGISSIIIEGGSHIAASALLDKIVDKVMFFIAPKVIGGKDALTSVEGGAPASLINSIKIRDMKTRRFGDDLLIEGYVEN